MADRMTPHQRAAYDRARVVPDDTFLQSADLQGPQPMPRNYLADLAREYGMPSISERLNSPTSGVGMLVDAVGGLGNALVVQPAQSFNRLLQQGYEPGNPQSAEDAFNVAGAAMVGGLAAPKPSNTVGIFGGRLAKTADHAKLAQAERMAAEGTPREQIWNQTGWFQGPDKKWRFEIDDSKSVVYPGYLEQTGKSENAAPFRDRMSHSGYTSAYPEASNINVQRISGQQFPERKNGGQYRDGNMWFDASSRDRGRSIALHELQHDAQGREGFARGGSPRQFTPEQIAAERKRLLADIENDGGWDMVGTTPADVTDRDVAMVLYHRLAGEVESRAVQERQNLTPEQRAARPPWLDYDVPENQQIVRFSNDGPSQSIGMSGRPDGTEPIKGYRGSAWGSSVAPSFNREPIYWASSNPELAADYAAHSFGRAGPSVTPAEFRFRNPLEIDADGAGWQQIPYGGKTSITDKVAMDARKAGHDGVVFRNVVDDVNGNMTAADTIAALQPGTVYSPLTGELLYANGGRPGAAVGAATNALAERPGIRAYHGSPHDFDKFDMSKIGTGEGAQAYGHGLYFAENEGVARSYRDTLSKPKVADVGDAEQIANQYLRGYGSSDKAVVTLNESIATAQRYGFKVPHLEAARDLILSGKVNNDTLPGKMYEVRINASPDDFLDWDKPLSQQSAKVRQAALGIRNKAARSEYEARGFPEPLIQEYLTNAERADKTGGQVVQGMKGAGHSGDFSQALREAGIPGIKYLDQGSRTAGEGSRNYVVFDDNLIEILRKYGLLGMIGGGAAAAGSSDSKKPTDWARKMQPGDA